MEDDFQYYHLELPIEAVRVVHTGLSQAVLEKWSGGDPAEQEDLYLAKRLRRYPTHSTELCLNTGLKICNKYFQMNGFS